jgi:hypothetical protein
MIYEAGGSGSLGPVVSGFLRMVKKPTPTGIRIKINERHNITNPTVEGRVPELLTPFT